MAKTSRRKPAAALPHPVPMPSPAPASLTNVAINPTGLVLGPCPQGCTVITALQFTVSGTVVPAPNPALWPVQGYVWVNGSRYAATGGGQVDPMTGDWALSFDLTVANPADGTTGQLKAYYTDPNDPASYLLSPICFNTQPGPPAPSPEGRRGRERR